MRPIAWITVTLLSCQGCTGEISGLFPVTDGGDAESGVAGDRGFAGAIGSAGRTSSGGRSGSGGAVGSGGRGGSAGTNVAGGGVGGIPQSGGAGGVAGATGTAGSGAGGAPKPCGLDSASCTSCLAPICPDAIQACTTSTACLDAVSLLAGCVCPAAPNGKTSDKCLTEFAGRGALEAPFAKCMQTATTCWSLCGL